MRNIPAELAERYIAEGWWTQETLGDLVAGGLQANPTTTFHVHSAVRPFAGTFRDVEIQARRLAAGLRSRGVGPGDVIAIQLPNWVEAAVAFWASAFLGAVIVPIVHFYGRKELGHIVSTSRPRVFITAEEFGRMKFQPDLCADVPIVGLVGENLDDLLADEPMTGTVHADPAGPALIAFTSGTTSNPKGVIHSHQTLGFETRQLLENYPPERGRQLTATPVGHFIGMLGAFLIPVLEGAPIDLCDVWDPGRVLELIESDGLSIGGGPPYFVTSVLGPPEVHAGARAPLHDRRSRRLDGSRGGHPAAGGPGHVRVPFVRQHRTSVDHRFAPQRTRGQAAVHRRRRQAGSGDPVGTRRRDLQSRSRSVPWLHR